MNGDVSAILNGDSSWTPQKELSNIHYLSKVQWLLRLTSFADAIWAQGEGDDCVIMRSPKSVWLRGFQQTKKRKQLFSAKKNAVRITKKGEMCVGTDVHWSLYDLLSNIPA